MPDFVRTQITVRLDSALLEQARALNIDVARAAEDGIRTAVHTERERRRLLEKAEARRETLSSLPSD